MTLADMLKELKESVLDYYQQNSSTADAYGATSEVFDRAILIALELTEDLKETVPRLQEAERECRRLADIEDKMEAVLTDLERGKKEMAKREIDLDKRAAVLEERETLYNEMRWMYQTAMQGNTYDRSSRSERQSRGESNSTPERYGGSD